MTHQQTNYSSHIVQTMNNDSMDYFFQKRKELINNTIDEEEELLFINDINAFIELFQHNRSMLADIFNIFCEDVYSILFKIKEDISAHQLEAASKGVHKLSKLLSKIQIRHIPILLSLKENAKKGEFNKTKELFDKVEKIIHQIIDYIRKKF